MIFHGYRILSARSQKYVVTVSEVALVVCFRTVHGPRPIACFLVSQSSENFHLVLAVHLDPRCMNCPCEKPGSLPGTQLLICVVMPLHTT